MSVHTPQPLAVQMYYRMRLIRRFEERTVELVDANEIPGITHESIGQEAVAVGVCGALRHDDVITSTHRGHGHVIAKGADVRYMFAELMGREAGYNKGRGGSMHIADMSLGIYGANGIVGAGVPMACGAAYTFRQAGSDRVACAFFGDAGINQGVVHEALNLAAIWSLPVIFVCENNLYAITTPIHTVTRLEIFQRGASYGMPSQAVDGMDVQAVYDAAVTAVARARAADGPTFIECRTYRYSGHFTAERALNLKYRSEEEINKWRERDPIANWSRRLLAAGYWTEGDRATADAQIEAELEDAVAFARQSPWPDPATALHHMYARPYDGTPARGGGG